MTFYLIILSTHFRHPFNILCTSVSWYIYNPSRNQPLLYRLWRVCSIISADESLSVYHTEMSLLCFQVRANHKTTAQLVVDEVSKNKRYTINTRAYGIVKVNLRKKKNSKHITHIGEKFNQSFFIAWLRWKDTLCNVIPWLSQDCSGFHNDFKQCFNTKKVELIGL